ncbi:MAG: (2Fe-2S) ferredoxin domain-containing protein [Anaerolineae bacterium]|nr:MAG: (2Fe-2S) ferredoxin domain-containing protein [Anaerolineae bacterium]
MHAILNELARHDIDAHVVTVGCIGMCARTSGRYSAGRAPRVTYGNVLPAMVPRLIEEHLIQGTVVEPWVVARMAVEPAAV